MVSGKMPMLIFILASGYLFAVYILLAIAKRSRKRPGNTVHHVGVSQSQSDIPVTQQVGEAIGNPESILHG